MVLAQKFDCKLVVFPANFDAILGASHWQLFKRSRAVDSQIFIAGCGPARNLEEPNCFQAFGHSAIISPWGKPLTECQSEETILYSLIDFNLVDDMRQQVMPTKESRRRNDMYKLVSLI
jgi:omega-amidase